MLYLWDVVDGTILHPPNKNKSGIWGGLVMHRVRSFSGLTIRTRENMTITGEELHPDVPHAPCGDIIKDQHLPPPSS